MVADLVLWSNYILVKLHIVTDIKVKQCLWEVYQVVADLVLWSNYILVKLHIVTDIKVKQWCGGRIGQVLNCFTTLSLYTDFFLFIIKVKKRYVTVV